MSVKSWIFWLSASIGLIVVGWLFLLWYLIKFKDMNVNPEWNIEFNPFEVFSAIMNIVLILLISYLVSKQNEKDRIIRDELIYEFKEFSQLVASVSNDFLSSPTDYNDATAKCKQILAKHTELYRWYEGTDFKVDATKKSSSLDQLRRFREIVTTTPIDEGDRSGHVSIKNNTITFNSSGIIELPKVVREIEYILFQIRLDINY